MQINKDTLLYFTSLIPGEVGTARNASLSTIFDMVRGGTSINDLVIFTDEAECQRFASRAQLLDSANHCLRNLDSEQLKEIATAIQPDQIDHTIDKLNHYCE